METVEGTSLKEIIKVIDDRFEKMEKKLDGMIEMKLDGLEKRLEEKIEVQINDGFKQYGTSVKYIRDYISDHRNGFRAARPFSQQTVIPRSISTYTVQKVPAEPWDPPGWQPE